MTTVLRTRVRLAAALVVGAAALTACGSGPSQVNAAFIVGDRSVSVDEIQQKVEKVVADEPAAAALASTRKLDLVSRELVASLIRHELLLEVARTEGIAVDRAAAAEAAAASPQQELPTNGQVPPEQLAEELARRARDQVEVLMDDAIAARLAEKYFGRITARLNAATVPDLEKAKSLANQLAEHPEEARSLLSAASGEGEQPQLDQELGANSPDTLNLAAPVGSVFILPPGGSEQGSGYRVLQLTKRDVANSPGPDFDPSSVDPSQLAQAGRYQLRLTALARDIRVSPRYGEWNSVLMTVYSAAEAPVSAQLVLPKAAAKP